jgi:hypothetical protein
MEKNQKVENKVATELQLIEDPTITMIADERLKLEDLKLAEAQAKTAMDSTPEGEAFTKAQLARKESSDNLADLEFKFKQRKVEIFEAEGTKKFDGSNIVMRKETEYDANQALIWAVDHKLYPLLELNKKLFKKVLGVIYNLFTETSKPQCQISSDLSNYLSPTQAEEDLEEAISEKEKEWEEDQAAEEADKREEYPNEDIPF